MTDCKNCYTSKAALNSQYCNQCQHELSVSSRVEYDMKEAEKGIKYQDSSGVTHACEGSQIIPNDKGTYILWTVCGKMDVPANKGFKGDDEISCVSCISKISGNAEEEFYNTRSEK